MTLPQPRTALKLSALLGAALTIVNTLVGVSTDALAKGLVAHHAAPQLMALSASLAVVIGLGAVAGGQGRRIFATATPRRVALRSTLAAFSTIGFFLALRDLPFVQMFLFMGLMPILGALLSGLILRERLRPGIWAALALGFGGMVLMVPGGLTGLGPGHGWGFFATLCGAGSIVLSRGICRSHTHAFAQVFYAQLACATLGLVLLPWYWQPMTAADLGLLGLYTLCLLMTRWLMVVIVRLLPAYVAMQIANIQFVWMVLVGETVFGETTALATWAGSALIIAAGVWLVLAQRSPAPPVAVAPVPAE